MAHEYKAGDYVRICARVRSTNDYRFGFVDEMLQYVGRTFRIRTIEKCPINSPDTVPDDGNCYKLAGIPYSWASSMFESVPSEGAQKFHVGDKVIVLPRKDDPNHYTNCYVDSMLDYVGREAIITGCYEDSYERRKKDDGLSYRLNIDAGKWLWSSNALALLATEQSVIASESPIKTNKTMKPFASKSETTAEIQKVLEERIEYDDQKYELNFNI